MVASFRESSRVAHATEKSAPVHVPPKTKVEALRRIRASVHDPVKRRMYPDAPTSLGDRPRNLRVRRDFAAFVEFEAVRMGLCKYQVIEELVAKGLGGRRPWDGKHYLDDDDSQEEKTA